MTRLIEATLAEVRAAPRSGDAWGRLGSVLMHYEFIEETHRAFEHAEAFSPRNPRWPHLHGLATSTRDVALATEKFRRAANLMGSVNGIARSVGPPAGDGKITKPLTDPRVGVSRLRLAQALAERGLAAEAETEFRALLGLQPGHPVALLGLARLRHAQWSRDARAGQWATSHPLATPLIEATNFLANCVPDPHTARAAQVLLSAIQQALGNPAAATAAARASAALPPDSPWPDPWWEEALAFRVGRKAAIEDATALLDQGRATEAITALGRATRDHPNDEEAWYLLGWALNQLRRSGEAERALREHLRRLPQSPKGHAQLAVALLAQQRHAEAIELLQGSVRWKPTWRELHSNLGYACVQLGRDQEAIVHFRNALALDPNHLPTYTALAELLGRRGAGDEAKRLLRAAAQFDPADARIRAMLERFDAGR